MSDEIEDVVLGEDERPVPCEACGCEGVVDGHPCAACDGFGWREP
jgi:hypothetical protein